MRNSVYIFSGPCGVGKSTITKQFAENLHKAVLLEGDTLRAMFTGIEGITWEEKVRIVWENLASLSQNFIQNELDVVLDYVVEEELEQFCGKLTPLGCDIYYIVLRAEEETLTNRIKQRGDIELIERSLFLLKKLETTPRNKPHLVDTTTKTPSELVKEITRDIEKYKLTI